MSNKTIDMRLCKRPQENVGSDPQIVCFPHQTPMVTPNSLLQFIMPLHGNPSFPELDKQLQHIWEAFVEILSEVSGTDVQPSVLEMSWDMVRKKLQGGMRISAYKRFAKWYGGETRRLE